MSRPRPSRGSASTRRDRSATASTSSGRRTGRRRDDRSRAGRRAPAKSFSCSSIGLPSRSSALHRDVGEARHHAADVGDAEAAFPALLSRVVAFGDDLGVDDDGRPRSSGPGSSSSSATNRRTPSCTCGAASPTPWYSCIVSIMSSMSFCSSGSLEARTCSSGRARSRSTGCPMRATFRIDMKEDYRLRDADSPMHPHDERPYSFCPLCGGDLEPRLLKPTEPERLVCMRCGFVFYLDPKVAVGTIIRDERRPHRAGAARHRARLRQVGVPRRLRRSRRGGARRPRSAKRARKPGSTSASIA